MADRGTVTNSTLQMGLALAGMLAGLGMTFLLTATGVLWAMRSREEGPAPTDPVDLHEPFEVPDPVPAEFLDREAATATAG